MTVLLDSVLIANRGEIACRILRTCRRLGIRGVAVYTDADAGALHVVQADAALRIDSYLSIDSVVAAAVSSGVAAIHPGYGFLSENPALAEACAAAGIAFVGPPAAAMRAMGSKAAAKRLMAAAGVPLVPGWHGADQSDRTLAEAAARIGFPILVKASAGGGGRGMRVASSPDALPEALAAARREAQAAFGDESLLLEALLDHPRHVEVQLFADAGGGVVTLFDRDCSVQRRHQKVIEEAPAPGLPESLRRDMAAAAVAAARAVGYVGAGTVEFLVQDGRFFFMEMNTRLQVEHPVTEMLTGLDLVEWQLVVASGLPLPLAQDGIGCHGHAIEARLYAEDPARAFLPSPGRLALFRPPPECRVETGLREGDAVSGEYDALIAKLVTWGEDRDTARRRLGRALAGFELAGPASNLAFLAAVADHPAFAAAEIDTGFIARHPELAQPPPLPSHVLAVAALAVLLRQRAEARRADPHSPWTQLTGWRLNGPGRADIQLMHGESRHGVAIHFRADGMAAEAGGAVLAVRDAAVDGPRLTAEIDGVRRRAAVVPDGNTLSVQMDGMSWRLRLDDPESDPTGPNSASGRLTAPLPGVVGRVLVVPGQRVARGQAVMVIEAMKMEHAVTAPADGIVAAIHFAAGDRVAEGAELLVLEAAP